jgi:hypothetical protein
VVTGKVPLELITQLANTVKDYEKKTGWADRRNRQRPEKVGRVSKSRVLNWIARLVNIIRSVGILRLKTT